MLMYKVVMKRKRKISFTDARGNVAERIEYVEETYGGLPHSTASSYKKKFPDSLVSMEIDTSFTGVDVGGKGQRGATSVVVGKKSPIECETPEEHSGESVVVGGGTYADAINAVVSESVAP